MTQEGWRGVWSRVATQNADAVYKLVLGVKGEPEAGESLVLRRSLNFMFLDHRTQNAIFRLQI